MNLDPNWASPPGETIVRLMHARELESDELASALGLSEIEFGALLGGGRRLTRDLAEVLSENLGSTVRFWMARDQSYLRDLAKLGQTDAAKMTDWVRSMPLASMRRLGWLSKGGRSDDAIAGELLSFFGCSSMQDWGTRYSTGVGAVAFRTSAAFASDQMATLIWLRLGERQAASGASKKYDASAFARLLPTLRKFSAFKRPKVIIERLREACWVAGVQVTCARAPEGCRASGASWFNADGNPVIHLSFRYLSEDHFWFTFFYESAHVLLHGSDHIDGDGVLTMGDDTERQEDEANDYARDIILPPLSRERLLHAGVPSPRSIMRVAREIGVTPGLIVGQLERDKIIPPSRLSSMKRRYRWVDDQLVPDLRA